MTIPGWYQSLDTLQQVCRDTFGVPVTYRPSVITRPDLGGISIQVTAIFEDDQEPQSFMGGGIDAIVPRTTLELRVADLGFDPVAGDDVLVNGHSYRVKDVQLDSHGTALLTLVNLLS
ncbi:MAG: hypothetical protein HQL65_14630 [Magnetococcales bacterium]|nr:hypothetical protein [Magnetococcales bacterium]